MAVTKDARNFVITDIMIAKNKVFKPKSMIQHTQDVSSPDSGRDLEGYMWKEMITSKRKLDLSWENIPMAEATAILTTFKGEYIDVTYYDIQDGRAETRNFYAGDKDTEVYSFADGVRMVAKLNFDLIER